MIMRKQYPSSMKLSLPVARRRVDSRPVFHFRSTMQKTPKNSDEAMNRARSFFSTFTDERPWPHDITMSLKKKAEQRFHYFDSIEGTKQAVSGVSPSSRLAGASEEFTSYNPRYAQTAEKWKLLDRLLSGILNDNITNVEAVDNGRTILPSFDSNNGVALFGFKTFGDILFEAFQRTAKIEYLNESITTHCHALKHPLAQYFHLNILGRLAGSFFFRFLDGHHVQVLDETMKLLSLCANDRCASLSRQFEFACLWTHFARHYHYPTVSTAYETAMSLMGDALLFAPILQLQHTTLVASFNGTQWLPLDYSSYQIESGQLKEAIETLERGRALLWSEMRDLRTSIDQLQQADLVLGQKSAAINRDLEALTKSIAPSLDLNMDDGGAENVGAVVPFGRLLLKQYSLLEERDELISDIQALPGFGTFWVTPSFDTLCSATSHGPVILINHSAWRSDILVLLHSISPSLILTSDDFYDRASRLRDQLIDTRNKHGHDSDDYEQTLAVVLAELCNLVDKPVTDRLRELKIPEQSRIWWCPTSVFCSLPLHAMGPIPSDNGENHYFLDLYICSYTPRLSALIQSHNRDLSSQSLLVGEIRVVQELGSEHHRFVHFACHGAFKPGTPFDAGFELYGGKRLTLLEIVHSHLPNAEFAFLSACHTAEMTEGSIMDEVVRHAAAAQYCGFRNVVGSM
ncbi:hypothetical protein BJY52DRAFT_420965 [Lactarius psammicola]|nr:hypothetical protein BJY52DRAFT_420965 [Lactarius psammicola]